MIESYKIMIKKIVFIIVVFVLLFSCKSTDKISSEKTSDDPTKYVIDKNKVEKDELKKNMSALFDMIEKYISKNDFEGWYNFLSKKYKDYLNNTNELQRLSELSDYLYNRNIVLRGARDYFKHLVVPARDGKSLEFLDYELINENNVNVISLFDKKERFVYKFVFEDGSWKLSL